MVLTETNRAVLCTKCANSLTPYPSEILERAIAVTYDFLQLRKDRSGGFSKQGQTYKSLWMEKGKLGAGISDNLANIVIAQVQRLTQCSHFQELHWAYKCEIATEFPLRCQCHPCNWLFIVR